MTTRHLLAVLAVAGIVAIVVLSPARQWTIELVSWIRDRGPTSAVVFAAAYVLAAVLLLPGSALTLGAGFIYGAFWGSLLVIPSATIGAIVAFAISRRMARGWVARKVEGDHRFAALDRAIGRTGFKIILLTRLSPIFPYNFLNYALGITDVRMRDYAAATALGMLPGTIMYVYLGSLVTTAADLGEQRAGSWFYWVGGIVAVVGGIAVTWIARRALQRELAQVRA
jgi:uncharacterized membrane protein YdjX (TVP38/TMEM64 family)